MGENATVERVGEGEYRITGMLNLRTINKLRQSTDRLMEKESGPIRIDLSGTDTKGVAGLALLSSLVRSTRNQGKELIFVNPPSSLLTLIEANGLSQLLSLSAHAPEKSNHSD